jgi:hypothetical protein
MADNPPQGDKSTGDKSTGDKSTGDKSTRSEPLDLGEDEDDVVIEQQNVGRRNVAGGGEWPDPDAPPSDAAPGSR